MAERRARRLTILNKDGLYCRPAAMVVKALIKLGPHTEVRITCRDLTVNGKSMIALLTLEAIRGRELLVEAEGPEAREVIEAVTEIVNAGFHSGEPCLPIPASHGEWIDLSGLTSADRGAG